MRTTMLLAIGSAILVSACADDPAASTSPRNASPVGASSMAPSFNGPSAQGKPTGPVGFTNITVVNSGNHVIVVGDIDTATATCPAGTTVIGGGYHFVGYFASSSPPWITDDAIDGANGWKIKIDNEAPGAGPVNIVAYAYCAS